MAKILVIDDDITIQLTLKRILLKQGYEVEIASDGEAGLEKAIALIPAVVVCDWMMPGMKGPEVCHRVRDCPELSATFFILLTAFDSVEDIVRGLDAGADDFLTKPPEISELKARIRTGVRSYELKRELQRKTQELEVGLRATVDYIRSLLPLPISSHILSFSSEWLPCPQLGGGGIVGHWLNDDALIFGVLEVAHCGIEAALQVAQLMSAMQCARMSDLALSQPDRVLATLQQQIAEQFQDANRAFSIWYGIFSPSDQQITYACAGNIKAVIVDSHGRVTQLASQEAQQGMMSAVPNESLDRLTASTASAPAAYTITKQPLNSGNTLYLIGSSLHQCASAISNEDIQWLLDAEAEAEAGSISEYGILAAAAANRHGQLGIDRFDGDVLLVRLRVH